MALSERGAEVRLNEKQAFTLSRFDIHEGQLHSGRNGETYDRLARLQVRGLVVMTHRGAYCAWAITPAGVAALADYRARRDARGAE